MKLTPKMLATLRGVSVEWGRPTWDMKARATIDALRRRDLYEFRQIEAPAPDPRFAPGKVGQVRLTPAGLAALKDEGAGG